MEEYTPRPQPAYPGEMTDENIRAIFDGAGDFFARRLHCGPWTLFAYAIDGLISGGDMSEYVLRPITEHLVAENLATLYGLNGSSTKQLEVERIILFFISLMPLKGSTNSLVNTSRAILLMVISRLFRSSSIVTF